MNRTLAVVVQGPDHNFCVGLPAQPGPSNRAASAVAMSAGSSLEASATQAPLDRSHSRPAVIPNRQIAQARSDSVRAACTPKAALVAGAGGVLAIGGAALTALGVATAFGRGPVAAAIVGSTHRWETDNMQNMAGAFMTIGGAFSMVVGTGVTCVAQRWRAPRPAPSAVSAVELAASHSNV